MRTTKAPRKQSTLQPRYSARYLLLIYRATLAHFDPLEIQRLVAREQAKCTIVRRRSHGAGEDIDTSTAVSDPPFSSYSAFVDFSGKRFQTRNLALFDVQGYHPRWIHVTSSPWQTLDRIIAQGDVVVWNGVVRPTKHSESSSSSSSSSTARKRAASTASNAPWELVGSGIDESDFRELVRKELSAETLEPFVDGVEECRAALQAGETEMTRNVQYWQDGYRAGFKAASSISRTLDVPCEPSAHFFSSSEAGDSSSCPQSDPFSEFSQVDWNLELDELLNPGAIG
ncbi:hypothetical protein BJX99DRAFT_255518 [Aspergillus californicus]